MRKLYKLKVDYTWLTYQNTNLRKSILFRDSLLLINENKILILENQVSIQEQIANNNLSMYNLEHQKYLKSEEIMKKVKVGKTTYQITTLSALAIIFYLIIK